MKWISLFVCGCALMVITGCMSSREVWRGRVNNARFGGFTAGPPVVVEGSPVRALPPQATTAR